MNQALATRKRLGVYIDGYNLYRGMCAAKLRKFLWLDLCKLAENIRKNDSQVHVVKYFTARKLNLKARGTPRHRSEQQSLKRQSNYIDAVRCRGAEVFEGKFKRRDMKCRKCSATWIKPEEKKTDVQLATQLLADAFRSEIDKAIVVSGDADTVPPIRMLTTDLRIEVVVAFPPKRVLQELVDIASGTIHLNKQILAKSLMPDVFEHGGTRYERPPEWR